MSHDPVASPEHYTVYPVQPIEITRHLGFCLGNAVKYVLRAPWKGGVEDCEKALEYLRLENATPQPALSHFAYVDYACARKRLEEFLAIAEGDQLWKDVSWWQASFLDDLERYVKAACAANGFGPSNFIKKSLADDVRELRRVLRLKETTGQIYEGMTGLPHKEAKE